MSARLAFEVMGEGTPLVILHGMFGSGRNWAPIARALSANHKVFLPDARNHGASPWADTMSYPDMAVDVLELIDAQHLQRPLVIGHSMGGKTAMALALQYPHAIGGIAVIDIAPEAYADQFSPYVTAMRGLDMAAIQSRSEIRQALASQLEADAPVDFLMQNLQRHDDRFDWRLNLMATALCMRDLCGFPAELMDKCYPGAALFIAGTQSGYVRPESHASISALFPRVRVESIAEAGHWVHADQPDALLEVLGAWLAEAGAPRAADALPAMS